MASERKQPTLIFDGKNIKLRKDAVEQNDGSLNYFYILTVQSETEGYFRDEKGTMCYGKRPPKAITFSKDYIKEMKEAVGSLK